jgi:anti-repressor protein
MEKLIEIGIVKGEARVDSRLIAARLEIGHRGIVKTIHNYKTNLEKYGKVIFEVQPSLKEGSTQKEIVYYLNEKQSTFLVTLSRNSSQAVEMKQLLTESYFHYREKSGGLTLPQTHAEALRALACKIEEKEQLRTELDNAQPAIEFADMVSRSPDCICIREFAKVLSDDDIKTGEKRLFKMFYENKVLLDGKPQEPFQRYIENGSMIVEEQPYTDKKGVVHLSRRVFITAKGQVYFTKKVKTWIAAESIKQLAPVKQIETNDCYIYGF